MRSDDLSLDLSRIIEEQSTLILLLLEELAQYRAVEKEEKRLKEWAEKYGK